VPSKMEVNAAIERLLSDQNREDLSDAMILVEFMRDVEVSDLVTHEKIKVKKNETESFVGNSEFGNVPYSSRSDQVTETSTGIHKVRVGYYKMWVQYPKPGVQLIRFQHFWRSDESTRGEGFGPPLYELHCENRIPISLATFEEGDGTHRVLVDLKLGPWFYKVEKEEYPVYRVILRGKNFGHKQPSGGKVIRTVTHSKFPWGPLF
jgi:hypothetical protein